MSIYIMKISLIGIEPLIWRRVQVPGEDSLNRLHRIIEVVMGWEGRYLYTFVIGSMHYGEHQEYSFEVQSDTATKLYQVSSKPGLTFNYIYDLNHRWEHALTLEAIQPSNMRIPYPICLAGERAVPPEDCHTLGGYSDFLEAIMNPCHENHDTAKRIAGGPFHPENFDLKEINERLKCIR